MCDISGVRGLVQTLKVLVDVEAVVVKVVRVLVEPIRGTGEAVKKDFVKQNNKLVLRAQE